MNVNYFLMGLVRAFVATAVGAGVLFAADAGERAYEQARQAERNGQSVQAYLLYSQAATLNPLNPLYALKTSALRPVAEKLIHTSSTDDPARPSGERFAEITGAITDEDLAALERMNQPVQLEPAAGAIDFHLKGEPKALWEQVAARLGLLVIFDRDYPPHEPLRFDLAGVDYRAALHALEDATNSFAVPLSARAILVAQDTQQKRTELESDEAVMVPIPDAASLQEAQELATAIQQTFEMRRFVVDPRKRMLFMRDRVSKVEGARLLALQLMHPKPQVAIEVEFLNVTESSSLNLGMTVPTQFPLVYFGNLWKNAAVAIPSGFTQFLTFGGGKTMFGIGVTSAEMFALASRSSGTSVLKSEIRVADGQPGTLHVGDKYPIVQAGFFGAPAGITGTTVTPPPTVNFEDLGVVLKVTPTVHSSDEVSLEVDVEYKVLGSQSYNGIPVISNRKFEAHVRLATSEYAVVSGLISETKTVSKTGMAWLSDIPLLGWLFKSTTKEKDSSQTLLVIKPHVIVAPPGESALKTIFVGSDNRPLTPI